MNERNTREIDAMAKNPLLQLAELGQSVWIDFIHRRAIESGQLARWMTEDGVCGVTSNPAIFEKAIAHSADYDDAIRELAQAGKTANDILDALTIEDVKRAADLLRPVFDRSDGRDGFVSLEVAAELAHDTAATIAEARRLWAAVGRQNVLIKVPATQEGVPALRQLVSDGINVNVTLLFALPRYREIVRAYIAGLDDRMNRGESVRGIASVASFFLSRIDVLLDEELGQISRFRGNRGDVASFLQGQVAVASAKVAYQMYKEAFATRHFAELARHGARTQRLLWASTSTKNPAYRDVKYVEALIGPDTVTTLPIETLEAYRDHGRPEPRLERGVEAARSILAELEGIRVDLAVATNRLEEDGIRKFVEPWQRLRAAIETKRAAFLAELPERRVAAGGRR